jgi:hypothetical protein
MSNKVEIRVSAIEVRAAQPKAADTRKIQFIAETRDASLEEIAYIVKLYVEDVERFYTSLGYRLFVGDYEIKKYAGFKNGIYFKVYDPDFLAQHAGEKVQFTIDGVEFVDTGVTFPEYSTDAEIAFEAGAAAGLPTQEQVLSE